MRLLYNFLKFFLISKVLCGKKNVKKDCSDAVLF